MTAFSGCYKSTIVLFVSLSSCFYVFAVFLYMSVNIVLLDNRIYALKWHIDRLSKMPFHKYWVILTHCLFPQTITNTWCYQSFIILPRWWVKVFITLICILNMRETRSFLCIWLFTFCLNCLFSPFIQICLLLIFFRSSSFGYVFSSLWGKYFLSLLYLCLWCIFLHRSLCLYSYLSYISLTGYEVV